MCNIFDVRACMAEYRFEGNNTTRGIQFSPYTLYWFQRWNSGLQVAVQLIHSLEHLASPRVFISNHSVPSDIKCSNSRGHWNWNTPPIYSIYSTITHNKLEMIYSIYSTITHNKLEMISRRSLGQKQDYHSMKTII